MSLWLPFLDPCEQGLLLPRGRKSRHCNNFDRYWGYKKRRRRHDARPGFDPYLPCAVKSAPPHFAFALFPQPSLVVMADRPIDCCGAHVVTSCTGIPMQPTDAVSDKNFLLLKGF